MPLEKANEQRFLPKIGELHTWRIGCINQDVWGYLYILVSSDVVLRCMSILATNTETLFASLTDCFAVNYSSVQQYHEIYYQLHSYKLDKTIFIVTTIQMGETVQSATILFSNSNFSLSGLFPDILA